MWPFSRRDEVRQASYTDEVVAALVSRAHGASKADPASLAAVQAASGLVSRAFAAAEILPVGTMATRALTAPLLALIGRGLILRGEVLLHIDATPGRVTLRPVSSWDISGTDDPASWRYRIDMAGPSRTRTISRPAEAVIHCRINVDPSRPWRGQSPIRTASLSAKLAAAAEKALAIESAISPARIAPIPTPDKAQRDNYNDALKSGGIVTVEASTIVPGASGQEPASRWLPQAVGPDPTAPLVQLRSDASRELLVACGVPTELFSEADGTGKREAWRQFLFSTVSPMAREVQAELGHKLNVPGLSINFDSLFASDLSGRARAFQSLVSGGMDTGKAAALAGLMEE